MIAKKTLQADEFGDFQTPRALASQVAKLLTDRGIAPASVIEPTCGLGNFLLAALDHLPTIRCGLAVDINSVYIDRLRAELEVSGYANRARVMEGNFFHIDWATLLRDFTDPILVIGNPPWITNAQLGVIGSANLPAKTNFQNHRGLDAVTGKSNFDISEWMLLRLLELLDGREATVAMLCKTAVARKALVYAWEKGLDVTDAEIRLIDTAKFFGAAVDACLLVCSLAPFGQKRDCRVYRHLSDTEAASVIGYHDGQLIADVAAYRRWKHLAGKETYKWRSGIKHDCSKVMELRKEGDLYRNGLGELVDLEDDYLYPMLKSSEVANGHTREPRRRMIVTQRSVGDETQSICRGAPKTWKYLQEHDSALDRRASSIYRNRPRFSVFGVGEYSFSPWKVAISGFYKKFQFAAIGGYLGKPVVLDDTAYFVSCRSEEEADLIACLLNSEPAREFFSAYVFWDSKRPITSEVLRRLDLAALARDLGTEGLFNRFLATASRSFAQGSLFELSPALGAAGPAAGESD